MLSTSLSDAEVFTLLKEMPNNGGGAGVLNGHDMGSVLTDAQIVDLVAFVRVGLIDDDSHIDGNGLFTGDSIQGQAHYTGSTGIVSCITCHGADGTAINFGTAQDPEWVGTIAVHNPWEFMHKGRFGQPGAPMPSFLRARRRRPGRQRPGRLHSGRQLPGRLRE